MLTAHIVVFTFAIAATVVLAAKDTFEPGCSFMGGQCMYQIKLGHSNQCDKPSHNAPGVSSGSNSNGCCGDLSAKYSQLKDNMEELKNKVEIMSSVIIDSRKNVSLMEAELANAKAARHDIVQVLNRKQSELASTKAELAKVMAKASKEIQTLRDNLANAKRYLTNCQTVLSGGDSSSSSKTPVTNSGSDYTLSYYNFNANSKDFKFSTLGNKGISIKRMTRRSSTGTGPAVEHSWGVSKGSYLGIDGKEISENSNSGTKTFTAESIKTFPTADAYCIMFWYYMEGKDVRTLTANVKIKGHKGYPIFSKTGPNKSSKWQLAQIDLDSEYAKYEFNFEFTMSSDARRSYYQHERNQMSDIAVDDLYIYNTTCSNIPQHPQTTEMFTGDNVKSFYTFHLRPMTWTEAYDVCRRESPWSALVSIQSKEEQQALVEIIRSNAIYNTVGAKGFYTSGTDLDSERVFGWTDTGVHQALSHTEWHRGQPNNVRGNQDCLLMEYSNDDYQWGDVDCDTKHPFICEVNMKT